MDPATILLVDDHEDFLESARAVLESLMPEVDVVTETDPFRALDILRRRRIDAVASDYLMPGMNGLMFLTLAAEIAPEARRMLITAYPDLGVLVLAINEADISYYVRKPMGAEPLADAFRDVLAQDDEPEFGPDTGRHGDGDRARRGRRHARRGGPSAPAPRLNTPAARTR